MPMGRWGTVTECAKELGVERSRVHQLIAKGALGEVKRVELPTGPVILIRYPFERKVLPVGRPRKNKGEEGEV